ncbi:hypothetical protein P1X14_01185 [Sphingomonas sp. AOB5]|uniref:hypothetical protein n=1 Tax=Sphingomonas sp. AOB5 TaxID=3034017 RepID=UPI0023F9E44A|nr:hypothetical protein [Sphingomonas sp. AOB5]MDF7773846.1 hypothetical protein [Sphingomonas sp. AOB5]
MRSPSPAAEPPPRNPRWEAITVAATFAFGGGLISLIIVGLAWFAIGPAFRWPIESGFVTLCVIAMVAGLPVLVIDRIRHREKQ